MKRKKAFVVFVNVPKAKGYARVRYRIVLANYAMIKAIT
jgi:hypothetical protein